MVVFGARTEVAVNVFESFFWLLDVMQQLSWEILLDEAVKEGRNHKRGNTRMSGTPRCSVWGGRAAGEIKGKAGSCYWLPNNEPCLLSHNVFQRQVHRLKNTASHAYRSAICYSEDLQLFFCKHLVITQRAETNLLSQQPYRSAVTWNRILALTPVIETSGLVSVQAQQGFITA